MFEQYPKSANGTEDIFANVEKDTSPSAVIRPRAAIEGIQTGAPVNPLSALGSPEAIQFQTNRQSADHSMNQTGKGRGKQVVVFILVVILLGVGAGAVAFFLSRQKPISTTNQLSSPLLQNANTPESSVPPVVIPPDTDFCGDEECTQSETSLSCPSDCGDPQPSVTQRDADQDGLSEVEERGVGTSDNFSDSDFDGLSDWDEVKVYHTNPVNPDSDEDGYIDGHEVQSGYNPNGEGKLGETPK